MQDKKGWIIFGSNSDIAKSLINSLKLDSKNMIFCIARNQLEKINSENIFYLTVDNFQIELKNFSDLDFNIILCNGKVSYKKLEDLTKTEVNDIVEANFISTVFFLQEVFRLKVKVKKVLLVGARAGMITGHHKFFNLYAASKMACLGLFRILSSEKPETLFTYFICPLTDTGIFNRGVIDQVLMEEVRGKLNTPKRDPSLIAGEILSILEAQKVNFPDLIIESKL